MIASSFFDPVLGVDIHWEMVPMPAPVPTPIPNPFTGIIFDPIGLAVGLAVSNAIGAVLGAPFQGPVVYWGAIPATNTGTEGKHIPGHILIPPGTAWAPVPRTPKPVIHPGETPKPAPPVKPENDVICVFGSKTVSVMGSNAVRLGDMAMSCSEPVRLPSSVVLAVPKGAPILIGGPPSLDLMAAFMASLRTRFVSDSLHALISRMKPSRFRNFLNRVACLLTGHPVDVASGRVITDSVDAQLPGPLPLKVERVYSSAFSSRKGPLGHGWSHSLNQAVWRERGKVVFLAEDGREIEFDTFDFPNHEMRPGQEVRHPVERLTLRRKDTNRWEIESHDGVLREFAPVAGGNDGRSLIQRIRSRCRHHEITFEYDVLGRLEWVRDCGGRLILLEHDQHGRLISLKLPHPEERGWYPHRAYEYDAEGDLIRVTDSQGATWSFEYAAHLLTRETDRTGLSFYFAYDGFGEDAWCVRTWGDGGYFDHLIQYDKRNHVTHVTDSLGRTRHYHMNLAGLVTKVVDPLGAETRYEYDPRSLQRTAEIDPLGNTRRFAYDPRGNLAAVIQSDGAQTTFAHDPQDRVVRATDAAGGRWEWRYNTDGLLAERRAPNGQNTRLDWSSGLLTRIVRPGERVTDFGYDPAKNLRRVTLQHRTELSYDCDQQGRVVRMRAPADRVTRVAYDFEGSVLERSVNRRVAERYRYDADGQLLSAEVGSRKLRFRRGILRRLAGREEGGHEVKFEYDTECQLKAVVNEAGQRLEMDYDLCGRVARERTFDGGVERFQRDLAGRIVRMVHPSGKTETFARDAVGRVVSAERSDGSRSTFTYRPGGLLECAANDEAEVRFEHDELGRVVRETRGEFWVEAGYGAGGERTLTRTSLGTHTAAVQDPLGYTAEVLFQPDSGRLASEIRFERDALGIEHTRQFDKRLELRWELDASGLPASRRLASLGPAGGRRETDAAQLRWDADGRLEAWIAADTGFRFFDRDARGRIVRERRPDEYLERRLDGAGFSSDSSIATVERDADGNVVRKVESDGSEWRFHWDGSNLLQSAELPNGSRVDYAYDALSRRTRKTFSRPGERGSVAKHEVRFVWDGDLPVHELDSADRLTTWRWEPGTFNLLAKEQGGRRWWVIPDHLGTPTEMYDEQGRLSWKAQIDVRGVAEFERGGPGDMPWRWPGHYQDAETGLAYNRFRYYDSTTEEYLSKDPSGLAGGLSPFGYVDDPTMQVDPFGLNPSVIALGLQNAPGTFTMPDGRSFPVVVQDSLDHFARHPDVNGTTARGFDGVTPGMRTGDPQLGSAIRQAMGDADRIHFNLQGMNNVAEILANPDPRLFAPGSTSWELATILSDPNLRAKTTFWEKPGEKSKRVPCGT